MRMLENIAVWVAVGLAVSTGGTALAGIASSSSSSAASSSSSSAGGSSSCATTTDTNSLNYTACNTIPVIDRLASQVCSPQQFFDSNGDLQTGTVDCSTDTTIADCTTNNASGCIATTTFKAGDLTNLVAGNIKGGVTVADVQGDQLQLADPWDFRPGFTVNETSSKLKVNCRNAANLATFDIDAGQSVTSVTIGSPGVLNVTAHGLANGTAVLLNWTTEPTGLSSAVLYYVVNSSTNSFQLSLYSGGPGKSVTTAGVGVTVHRWKALPAVVDIWDTIDDSYGLPASTGFPQAWSVANNYCGGVDTPETAADDDNVWKDVTTTDGTTGSTCAETPANCTMKDKISGLSWSNSYRVSGSQSTLTWWSAVKYCNASAYNGQLAGSWRMPTQKELLNAYEHGITSAASANWMTLANMQLYFWSASSDSLFLDKVRTTIAFTNGGMGSVVKTTPYNVVCVR